MKGAKYDDSGFNIRPPNWQFSSPLNRHTLDQLYNAGYYYYYERNEATQHVYLTYCTMYRLCLINSQVIIKLTIHSHQWRNTKIPT